MTMVVERVTDMVRDYGLVNTFEGRLLAGRIAELVDTVLERSMAAVPVEACPGINPPTPES